MLHRRPKAKGVILLFEPEADNINFRTQLAPQSGIAASALVMTFTTMTRTPISPINTGLPSFTSFKKLPLELRLMVWGFALPGPRVIHLKLAANKVHGFAIASEIAASRIKAVTTIPGVLHAVHESREAALKYYSVAFEDHPKVQTMFFNFDHDYLHISLQLLGSLFGGPDMSKVRDGTLRKIRKLMIDQTCQLSPLSLDTQLMGFFKSLNHIIIPYKYPVGDFRRARHETAGIHHFKHVRRSEGKALPEIDVEYKTAKEIMDMSRAML